MNIQKGQKCNFSFQFYYIILQTMMGAGRLSGKGFVLDFYQII